jgi:hypothetical protein
MAKDSRLGESLWCEWSGCGYDQQVPTSIVFYTFDHVDLDNEIVRKALASTLQRDGVADGLSDAFKLIADAHIVYGWAGTLEEELDYYSCDESGETEYGDFLDNLEPITWIEV